MIGQRTPRIEDKTMLEDKARADSLALNYKQPTVEDYYSDTSNDHPASSNQQVNVASKRDGIGILGTEQVDLKQVQPSNIDLRSDSGYSSYGASTSAEHRPSIQELTRPKERPVPRLRRDITVTYSPTYSAQSASAAPTDVQGSDFVQPQTPLRRSASRGSSTTRIHAEESHAGYWVPGMPEPYPILPAERDPYVGHDSDSSSAGIQIHSDSGSSSDDFQESSSKGRLRKLQTEPENAAASDEGSQEIRLRVDGKSQQNLQLAGHSKGRTLQHIPADDGMSDVVINPAQSSSSTGRPARYSNIGSRRSTPSSTYSSSSSRLSDLSSRSSISSSVYSESSTREQWRNSFLGGPKPIITHDGNKPSKYSAKYGRQFPIAVEQHHHQSHKTLYHQPQPKLLHYGELNYDEESSEGEYTQDEEEAESVPDEDDPREEQRRLRTLMPPPKLIRPQSQRRPSLSYAKSAVAIEHTQRSTTNPMRRPSISRPRPHGQTKSEYVTPQARIEVNNSRNNRPQSYQAYEKAQRGYAREQSRALEERYKAEQKRQRLASRVYFEPGRRHMPIQSNKELEDEEPAEKEWMKEPPPTALRTRRRTDANKLRKEKESAAESKNRMDAAEEYIMSTRGSRDPYADSILKAAKWGGRMSSSQSNSGRNEAADNVMELKESVQRDEKFQDAEGYSLKDREEGSHEKPSSMRLKLARTWHDWRRDVADTADAYLRNPHWLPVATLPLYLLLDAIILATDGPLIATGQLEPPLRSNKVRLRWSCKCGDALFSDVEELGEGGINELISHMHKSAGSIITATPHTQHSSNQQYVVPRPGRWIRNGFAKVTSVFRGSSSKAPPSLPRHANTSTSSSSTSSQTTLSQPPMLHLLACMHHNRSRKFLQQDRIEAIKTDRALLCFMRQQYVRHRGRLLNILSLKSVQGIYFVKFRLPIGGSVVVQHHDPCCISISTTAQPACECIPPKIKVEPSPSAEYRCVPGPPATYPPVPPEYLKSLFTCPSDVHEQDTWILDQLPKRICGELQGKAGQPADGWGIYYEEGWDSDVIILFVFLTFLLASLLFGVLWSRFQFDVQGAFGVSAYMVTASGILVTLLASRVERRG